jgi:hypothetical protein
MNKNDLSPQEAKDLRLLLEHVTELREEQLRYDFMDDDEIRGDIKREINTAKRVLAHLNQPPHTMETPLQGTINVHEAFVTMTVPVSIAMRVADYGLKEMGDSHLCACENVEQMLVQDLEEEYGIDRDMAMKYHERAGYYKT